MKTLPEIAKSIAETSGAEGVELATLTRAVSDAFIRKPARLVKTRWYFSVELKTRTVEGYVEFAQDVWRADVFALNGKPLWSTRGIRRRDGHTARMVFDVFVTATGG